MVEFDDDDLFEGLESDSEPQSEFDVAAVLRRVKKLDYKLEKQKEYKKHIEQKLKAGVEKTDEAIETLKAMVLAYMKHNKKTKLSFDDVGTVSLVNLDKEDWSLPTDKDQLKQLVDKLVASKTTSAFKTEYKLDVKDFRDVLANRPEIVKELSLEGVVFGPVEPHLSFRKK